MNPSFEFDVVVRRVAGYINTICRLKSRRVVKVSKIFGDDTEASDLLTEMLGNKHIRNEILESLCHCTFQGKAQFRELIVVPISRIEDVHVDMIIKYKRKSEVTAVAKRPADELDDKILPSRKGSKLFGDLTSRQQANVCKGIKELLDARMDISGPEVERVAMQLLPKSLKNRLIVPEPTVTCTSSLPEVNVKQLKSLHHVFSAKTKEVVVNALKHCTSDDEMSAVLNAVKKRKEALQGITIKNVKNWIQSRTSTATARRGRRINHDFEMEVLKELVTFCVEDNVVKVDKSIAFSYLIVQQRALKVQQLPHWHSDERVQKLKFSLNWVFHFLKRMNFSRRRITTDGKAEISVEEVRRLMKVSQDEILASGYNASQILNLDETALNFAIGPTYAYLPIKQARAIGQACNTKARVTLIPTVAADGQFLPLMFILKHSQSSDLKPDQTSMKVVKNLFKKPGFSSRDGWTSGIWQRKLMMINKKTKKEVPVTHKVFYIQHGNTSFYTTYSSVMFLSATGHVITSQCRAWNDSIRMAMLIDLIIGIWARDHGKLFLWMDNCGSHKTSCLSEVYENARTKVGYLPPNMTSKLQVLDLVVNGPIKSHIRGLRAKRIGEYFDEHRANCAAERQKPLGLRNMPELDIPKPSLEQCIKDLMHLFSNDFRTDKFRQGIQKSFLSTGTMFSISESGERSFVIYSESSGCGPVPIDVQKAKDLGLIFDEDHIVLDEDELIEAAIEIENNDFQEISEDEDEEEEEDEEEDDDDEDL